MQNKNKKLSGLSLMEMIVAIAIFTMAIAGFSTLFIRSIKSNSYIMEMGQASFATSQGMTKMVEYARKAKQGDNGNYPITSFQDNSFSFYSDYDSDGVTERLHFYLENQTIKMGITSPTGGAVKTYQAGDEEIKILAENIINEVDEEVFRYYNNDYPANTSSNPISTTTGDVSTVRMVEIFLKMNTDPNRVPDSVESRSFVELRNLNDYDRIK